MIRELENIILTRDLPENKLTAGDVGTVVLVHQGGKGFEVEFTALDGETLALVTLLKSQIRPVKRREIAHVRELASA